MSICFQNFPREPIETLNSCDVIKNVSEGTRDSTLDAYNFYSLSCYSYKIYQHSG